MSFRVTGVRIRRMKATAERQALPPAFMRGEGHAVAGGVLRCSGESLLSHGCAVPALPEGEPRALRASAKFQFIPPDPQNHPARKIPGGMIQRVKKASQSLPPAGGKEILIIFCRGAPQGGLSCPFGAIHLLYLTENTTQAASVRLVRCKRTRRARGRLQSFCQKRAKPFFDSLSSRPGNSVKFRAG